MSVRAPQIHCKSVSEVRNVAFDFSGKLDDGELLTGTPTVTDETGDLTISNVKVNTEALTILGNTVAVGQAVQFRVSGGTAGASYDVAITVSTNATPAQTLRGVAPLNVIED